MCIFLSRLKTLQGQGSHLSWSHYSKGLGESSFKYICQIDFKEYKPRQKEIQDFTDILRQNTSIYKGYTIHKIHTVKHRWGQEQRLLAQMIDWCDKIKAYVP